MNYTEMKHSIRVIVPLADNDGASLENQIEALKISLSERYGGATVYNNIQGIWISDNNDIMNDNNIVIESFSDEPITEASADIIASYVIRECRQMASSLIIDGVMRIYS